MYIYTVLLTFNKIGRNKSISTFFNLRQEIAFFLEGTRSRASEPTFFASRKKIINYKRLTYNKLGYINDRTF